VVARCSPVLHLISLLEDLRFARLLVVRLFTCFAAKLRPLCSPERSMPGPLGRYYVANKGFLCRLFSAVTAGTLLTAQMENGNNSSTGTELPLAPMSRHQRMRNTNCSQYLTSRISCMQTRWPLPWVREREMSSTTNALLLRPNLCGPNPKSSHCETTATLVLKQEYLLHPPRVHRPTTRRTYPASCFPLRPARLGPRIHLFYRTP
jgi:hypothetical protein